MREPERKTEGVIKSDQRKKRIERKKERQRNVLLSTANRTPPQMMIASKQSINQSIKQSNQQHDEKKE